MGNITYTLYIYISCLCPLEFDYLVRARIPHFHIFANNIKVLYTVFHVEKEQKQKSERKVQLNYAFSSVQYPY